MELWDLYTKDRQPTGKTHVRGDLLPAGMYHILVHLWIRNSKGEYIISHRAEDRGSYPGYWECPGGSVQAGEDSPHAALREALEEVGVQLDPAKGKIAFTRMRTDYGPRHLNEFTDVWLFEFDGEPSLAKALTPEEVSEVRWMTREEIERLWAEEKFLPTANYFFDERGKLL